MPLTPVRLEIPAYCPKCGAPCAVYPMPLMHGPAVDLMWFCRACRHEWPIVRGDEREPPKTDSQ